MKRTSRWWIIAVLSLSLCLLCGAAAAEPAPEGFPQFPWKGNTWVVNEIHVNPDHIIGNQSPETDQYLLIHLKSLSGPVPIADIVQSISLFSLVDAGGNAYPAAAYMPCTIEYNDRNGVFMTAMEQTSFDLFFIVPAGTDATSFTFTIDSEAACSFSETALAGIIQ